MAKVVVATDEKEQRYDINNKDTEVKAIRMNKKNNVTLTYLNLFIKRVVDIIGGLVGTIILIPLTVIIGVINTQIIIQRW